MQCIDISGIIIHNIMRRSINQQPKTGVEELLEAGQKREIALAALERLYNNRAAVADYCNPAPAVDPGGTRVKIITVPRPEPFGADEQNKD